MHAVRRPRQVLVRAIDPIWKVRMIVATGASLVETARRRHKSAPVATAALGRTMMAAALLSAYLKPVREQRIQVQIQGPGPLRELLAECNGLGQVRGHVRVPDVDLPLKDGKWDVARAIGPGTLTVIRDLGMGVPYAGTVRLVSGELAKDLAHYLLQSEQTHSAVMLGVLIRRCRVLAAGGCLIERLPDADEARMEELSDRVQRLGSISRWLLRHPDPKRLLDHLLAGGEPKILEWRRLRFHCTCTRNRALYTLIALDRNDLLEDLRDRESIEVTCGFCRRVFRFRQVELDLFLKPRHYIQ